MIPTRLEWRLPAAIAVLLLVVTGTLAGLTYAEARRAAVVSAGVRLTHLARQLAQSISQNGATLRRGTALLAADTRVVDAVLGRPTEAARAMLDTSLRASQQTYAIEVWNRTGRSMLRVAEQTPAAVSSRWAGFPQWGSHTEVVLSPPIADDGVGAFAIAAPVRDGDTWIGYLVAHLVLGSPSNSGQMVLDLIGSDSRLFIGRPDTGWVDLLAHRPMLAPEALDTAAGGVYWTTTEGTHSLGAVAPIEGMTWQLRVQFPERVVTAPSRLLLRNVTGIALVVTLVGAVGGWAISRRLIGPLRALTRAAAAVADGDTAPKIAFSRRDEIGALAAAFNIMTTRVRDARRDLERRVAERTEELRNHATLLERSNRELEAFSYTISHDLRAPLRSIDGFSEALVTEYADKLDAQGVNYLTRVRRAAKRMDELILDLLDLARVSRVDLRPGEVDLERISRRIAGELQERHPARVVDIHVEPGLRASGDPRLLTVVMQNLLDNAWKFTGLRDRAAITVGRDPAHSPPAYFVRDNGVGFDMAHAGKLFGIFQRLHSIEEFPGTGVGLAIVSRIVERHGGRAWAEARPGEGATFFFTLEAAPGRTEASHV